MVEITLAKFTPGTTNLRPSNAIARTVQHELGHTEGLPHLGLPSNQPGKGLMAPGTSVPESQQKAIDLLGKGDDLVFGAKSSIQGPKTLLPPQPPFPIGNLTHGPVIFASPPTGFHRFEYPVGSDPTEDDIFTQFSVFLGVEPESVSAPMGWDFEFDLIEPNFDFILNEEFVTDSTGVGWLHYFTDALNSAIDPGETLSFSFDSLLGPNEMTFRQVFGVSVEGDAQFLVVPIPEPSTWLLFAVGILSIIGMGYRQRKKVTEGNPCGVA